PDKNPRAMAAASEGLVRTIKEKGIEATCAMEGLGLRSFAHSSGKGRPMTVFDIAKVAHLLFWFESPIWADAGRYAPFFGKPLFNTRALVHAVDNAATAREMREKLGMANTVHTPWAVDAEVFAPRAAAEPEYDVVVSCGKGNPNPTPLALKELDSDTPDMQAIRQDLIKHIAPFVKDFASKSPKPAEVEGFLTRLLASQLESRHTPLLERMETIAGEDYKHAVGLQTIAAAPAAFIQAGRIARNVEISERAFLISWLSRRFKTLIVGEHNLAPWGARAENAPAVRHPETPAALARGRVVVHTTRWQDDAGLGTRPFEIAACGLAGLVQRRPGVESLFDEGKEMEFFDGPAQAAEKVRALLADPSRRAAIGAAARARVEREHTWKHRAERLAPAMLAAKQRLA
ncbi:MAG: glycosyltransferase family protein, partial [Phycisphaerales bacterium]